MSIFGTIITVSDNSDGSVHLDLVGPDKGQNALTLIPPFSKRPQAFELCDGSGSHVDITDEQGNTTRYVRWGYVRIIESGQEKAVCEAWSNGQQYGQPYAPPPGMIVRG